MSLPVPTLCIWIVTPSGNASALFVTQDSKSMSVEHTTSLPAVNADWSSETQSSAAENATPHNGKIIVMKNRRLMKSFTVLPTVRLRLTFLSLLANAMSDSPMPMHSTSVETRRPMSYNAVYHCLIVPCTDAKTVPARLSCESPDAISLDPATDCHALTNQENGLNVLMNVTASWNTPVRKLHRAYEIYIAEPRM